jgi:PAS domain S-box-containing protein
VLPPPLIGAIRFALQASSEEFSLSDLFLAGLAAALAAAFLLGRYWRSRQLALMDRARERYRLLAEHASDMLSTHAADGTFLYASPALERLLGEPTASLRGRQPMEFAHPDDVRVIISATMQALQTGQPVLATWRCRRSDGKYSWLETNGRAVPPTADPGAPRFISASRDVTRRKQVETALRDSERRFRATIEATNLVAIALDRSGQVTFCNDSLLVLTGWSREELIGANWFERAGMGSNEWHSAFLAAMSGVPLPPQHESELVCRDGRQLLIAWDGNVLLDPDQAVTGAAFLGLDVTQRRGEEAALQMLNAITLAIGAAESFDDAVRVTLRLLSEAAGWPYAEFWSVVAPGQPLERAATDYVALGTELFELVTLSESLRFAAGDGLPGTAFAMRRGVWLEDVTMDSCAARMAIARACGLNDGLAVPVLAGDSVVAVMTFFISRRRHADERHMQIVSVVANQLGTLILRKRAEEELRLEQERFRNAFEYSGIGMALVAPDGRWLRVNAAVSDIIGYSESELLASSFQDVTHPDDLKKDLALVAQLLAGEIKSYQLEKRYLHRDGDIVWVQLTVSLVRDRIGLPVYFISQIADITEARAAEAALRESETRLRTIVESMDEGLVITDLDERIRFVNGRFLEMTGYAERALIGAAAEDFVVSTADRGEMRDRISRRHAGEAERYELQFVRQDGSLLSAEIGAVPLTDGAGVIIGSLSTVTDIEARKRHEAAILNARDAAENANRAKSEFLARMSHELRTPLNAIIGFSRLLQRNRDGTIGPEALKFLERIGANGQHLLTLITDILDLSRIESGRVDVALAPTGLVQLVAEVIAQIDLVATTKGLQLIPDLPSEEVTANVDALRLKQVLLNLIGNAVKFTEHGSVSVVLHVDPRTKRAVRLDIADTGIGIPPDRLAAVFEPFEQVDVSTTRKYGGTGLGLPISRALCEAMKLDLSVQSTLGRGSTFSIHFDVAAAELAA